MPSKPIELPPEGARDFIRDMRAYFAEKRAIKADEIAARQLHALKQHYSGRLKLTDEGDVSANEGSISPSAIRIALQFAHLALVCTEVSSTTTLNALLAQSRWHAALILPLLR